MKSFLILPAANALNYLIFTQSVNKHLLSTYYRPGTKLSPGDIKKGHKRQSLHLRISPSNGETTRKELSIV